MVTGGRIVRSLRSSRGAAEMGLRVWPRANRKAVDPKLHELAAVPHGPAPPTRPQLARPTAKCAAGLLAVAALGALLWFPWPGLNGLLKSPTAPALIVALPPPLPSPAPPRPVQPMPAALPEPISAQHAEPARVAAPPVPGTEPASTSLPPQGASRVLTLQPPLPPMPSLAPSVAQLAAVVPAPPRPTTSATAVQSVTTGTPAWIRNSVPAPARNGLPRIAIVIDDLGLDRARSARAIALPAPLTLAFLPYATELESQTEAARKAGHELLVHVPMEPIDKSNDAGPSPLDIGLSSEAVLQRLRWDLSRFDGYVGIDNHMGSRFTGDAEALQPVMQELHDRGLLFIDSRTVAHSAGPAVAARYGVPHAGRDVFLDDEMTSPAIQAQLAELERVARRNGSAIAIGHPHDATLEALKTWLRDAPSRGFALVPVSAIVKERAGEG